MTELIRIGRSLALGLAAAAVFTGSFVILFAGLASAQTMPLAERIQQCAGCHGEDGNSRLENVPSLAGQPAFFVLNQLFLMREGVRKVESMAPFVKELKDEDLTALSEHYAKLPPKKSDEPIDPTMVKRGEAISAERRCGSCHGPTFGGREQIPRIGRQRIDFLVHVMKEFRDKPRDGSDTLMSASVARLSDADLTALAHYAASR